MRDGGVEGWMDGGMDRYIDRGDDGWIEKEYLSMYLDKEYLLDRDRKKDTGDVGWMDRWIDRGDILIGFQVFFSFNSPALPEHLSEVNSEPVLDELCQWLLVHL